MKGPKGDLGPQGPKGQDGSGTIDTSQFATKTELNNYATTDDLKAQEQKSEHLFATKSELNGYVPNTSSNGIQVQSQHDCILTSVDDMILRSAQEIALATSSLITLDCKRFADTPDPAGDSYIYIDNDQFTLEHPSNINITTPTLKVNGLLVNGENKEYMLKDELNDYITTADLRNELNMIDQTYAPKTELTKYIQNTSTQKDCMAIECVGNLDLNATTGSINLTSMWGAMINCSNFMVKCKFDNVSSTVIECNKNKSSIEHEKMIDIVSQERVTLLCGVHMADLSNEMFDVTSPKMKVRGTLVNGEDKEYATKEYVDQHSGGGGVDSSKFIQNSATEEGLIKIQAQNNNSMYLNAGYIELVSKDNAMINCGNFIVGCNLADGSVVAVQVMNDKFKLEHAKQIDILAPKI
ncbi:hypothetical protein TRFO_38943 [Tritrichomonas foetus]|uniref:Uncharacterized protein n=1 Tax=Tritrichomonas foetus TaxID=1144522 RepID=A0A1J4JB16_9EUKA|nr:hypothetical protein TRFO_38943 [Tritrichomonas foetus]|eukprot:OHS94843.1 hypothetical protein TRFO_38943 [Tritrichomonas foetus]